LLALGLYSPDVFDAATGKLTPEAVKLDDLLGNKAKHPDQCGRSAGLSVARSQFPVAEAELEKVLSKIVSRPRKDGSTRTIAGYATVQVSHIISLDSGILIVLDDGCECFTTHAVIRGVSGSSKSALRGPRDDLVRKLNENIRLSPKK
jgi:hypothetical protein